jgi:hypothetical protein
MREPKAPKETITTWVDGKLVTREIDSISAEIATFADIPKKPRRGPDPRLRRRALIDALWEIAGELKDPLTVAEIARKLREKKGLSAGAGEQSLKVLLGQILEDIAKKRGVNSLRPKTIYCLAETI